MLTFEQYLAARGIVYRQLSDESPFNWYDVNVDEGTGRVVVPEGEDPLARFRAEYAGFFQARDGQGRLKWGSAGFVPKTGYVQNYGTLGDGGPEYFVLTGTVDGVRYTRIGAPLEEQQPEFRQVADAARVYPAYDETWGYYWRTDLAERALQLVAARIARERGALDRFMDDGGLIKIMAMAIGAGAIADLWGALQSGVGDMTSQFFPDWAGEGVDFVEYTEMPLDTVDVATVDVPVDVPVDAPLETPAIDMPQVSYDELRDFSSLPVEPEFTRLPTVPAPSTGWLEQIGANAGQIIKTTAGLIYQVVMRNGRPAAAPYGTQVRLPNGQIATRLPDGRVVTTSGQVIPGARLTTAGASGFVQRNAVPLAVGAGVLALFAMNRRR